ncbi:MAG: KilA-N domain-containing protein [Gallionella sp.]|nr:KilA-N domain-containing protein [Gallionella sp.]
MRPPLRGFLFVWHNAPPKPSAPPAPPSSKAEDLARAYGASEQTIERIKASTANGVGNLVDVGITKSAMTSTPLNPYEQPLELGGVNIRQDYEGRYCLNDLHKASGGSPNDKPSNFLANKKTQELVEAFLESQQRVTRQPIVIKQGGTEQGTYAEREFVIAYATWISAPFFLKVIRAYDQLATKGIVVHEDHVDRFANDPMKMLEVIGEQMKKIMGERDAALKDKEVPSEPAGTHQHPQ